MSETEEMGAVLTFVIAICCIICSIGGVWLGIAIERNYCQGVHKEPMKALGIEKFQKCEINTTNCHSNWYEIVWKKDKML